MPCQNPSVASKPARPDRPAHAYEVQLRLLVSTPLQSLVTCNAGAEPEAVAGVGGGTARCVWTSDWIAEGQGGPERKWGSGACPPLWARGSEDERGRAVCRRRARAPSATPEREPASWSLQERQRQRQSFARATVDCCECSRRGPGGGGSSRVTVKNVSH